MTASWWKRARCSASAENDFILNAALHQYAWLKETAYGFDVTIEDMSDELCGLALQGPNSRQILQAFGVSGIEKLAHFGLMETDRRRPLAAHRPRRLSPAISAMRSGSSRRMRCGCGTRC